MKVTEKFLEVYEDVLKGRIPLREAQIMFCGGEDKNRWYNLKSRLKDEVANLETFYGITEKEAGKKALQPFTNSKKFLYLYEKVLNGDMTVIEAQKAMCAGSDNLGKWYNTKAKEKEAVAQIEKRYNKKTVKGKVVDLEDNKRVQKPKKKGVLNMTETRVRQIATKGEMPKRGRKPKKVAAVEEQVEKGVGTAKGVRKPVAGMPSVKAYFLKLFEDMLKSGKPEAEMREKFEGTEGVGGKWNNYKYANAKAEVQALKEKYAAPVVTEHEETVVEGTKPTAPTADKSATSKGKASTAEKSGENAKAGVGKGKGSAKSSKAAKGAGKKAKAANKAGASNKLGNSTKHEPKKIETPKKEKKGETPNSPVVEGENATKVALHTDTAKVLAEKIVNGNRKGNYYCFIAEYLSFKEGLKSLDAAKAVVTEYTKSKGQWFTIKYNYTDLIAEIDRQYKENKHIFTIDAINAIKEGLLPTFVENSVEDVENMQVKEEKAEEVEKPSANAINVLKSLGAVGIEDISMADIEYKLPEIKEDIVELRTRLYHEYIGHKKSKEEIRVEGHFDSISDVDRWLKRKMGKKPIVVDDSEDIEVEKDESSIRNKEVGIINPNKSKTFDGFTESAVKAGDKIIEGVLNKEIVKEVKPVEKRTNEVDEVELSDETEDMQSYDEVDEDIDIVDDTAEEALMETLAEEVNKESNKGIVEEIKAENTSLIDLIKAARVEQKQEHTDGCPYNCINGKILLESRGYVPCPHCMGIEKKAELLDESNEVNLYNLLKIPPQYRDIERVEDDVLKGLKDNVYVSNSILEVTTVLNNMTQAVRNGNVYGLSAYIHISNFVDIRRYVYGLQREAVKVGVGTVPYISLNTLAALLYASNTAAEGELEEKLKKERLMLGNIAYTTNAFKRLATDFPCDYYDYCKAPLVILEATAETLKKGWSALADLLSERTREGLPTVVFGYAASTSPSVVNELKWLVGENADRLDLLTVVELKTEKGMLGKRSFNNIANINGEGNVGLQIPSMMVNTENTGEVRKAKDVFRGI